MDDVTPGNPAGIRELARHWTQQGEAADSASSTLGTAKENIEGGSLRLKGDFAPKIKDAIGDLPGELRKLAQGYRGCGRALDTFATKLTEAQQKSRRARDDGELAARNKRNAEYDLDALAPGWDAHAQSPTGLRAHLAGQPEPVMSAVSRRESADRDVDLATTLARQAAALRGDAERDCVREIKDAFEGSGLKNRTWYQKVGDYLKESFTTWDGFVKFCESVSLVLGVIALFLTGPLALIVGAVLLVAAAVAIADKVMKVARGEIGWGELAFELGMVVLARFGGRALGPAFRRLGNSKAIRGLAKQMHKAGDRLSDRLKLGDRARNLAHRGICTVTGHPIDVATGKMFTDVVDLELPGPLPFTFERVWYSTSTYAGPLGHGWHHRYDAALYADGEALLYRTPDGRIVDLLPLYPDTEYYDRQERLTVSRDESGYWIRDSAGVSRRFAPVVTTSDPVVHVLRDVVNRAGHRISLSYDARGLLVEMVDSGGRELRFEHDEAGRITTFTAPHPDQADQRFAVARYTYDEVGNLTSVVDALDHRLGYAYTGHLMVAETNRTGLTFHFEYDGHDERARCRRTWGDGGIYDHTLTYEPAWTTVVNSLGHQVRHEHEQGLVIRTVDALGAERRTGYEYQQPVELLDALGRAVEYEYDYRGNPVRSRTPDRTDVRISYNEQDLPVQAIDQVGGQWECRYDTVGRLQERRDSLGRSTVFGYRGGLLASLIDPTGGRTTLDYDERGSLTAVHTPDGGTIGWQRDRLGRPVAQTDPLGNQRRQEFDLVGRVVRLTEPDGNVRVLGYDGEGELVSAVDRLRDIRLTYQGMGRLASRSQGGTTVRFEYNTEEQLTGVVNEHGRVYGFAYSQTGALSTERGFDDLLRLYERDLEGRVVAVREASGLVTRYGYDAADRPTEVRHSDGTGTRFEYRDDGALLSAENDTATVRFERDPLGRVIREVQALRDGSGDHWVSSEYDPRGTRSRVRSSLGADQQITRDPHGRTTGVSANGYEIRFHRDQLGQELTRELPGGVRARWHRDELGRPVRHEVSGPAGSGEPVRDRQYDWDAGGRLRAVIDATVGPIGYQYDELGQLLAASYPDGRTELRMPDAVGNLFRTAERDDRVYGAAGQVLESTDTDGRTTRYGYDAQGRLASKTVAGEEHWSYRWNADGHLAEVTRPDGSVVEFGYDALGRRVSKRYRGQHTRWVWDGDVPLHEWVTGSLADEAPVSSSRWAPDGVRARREAELQEYLRRGPPERGSSASPITWLFDPDGFAPIARLAAGRQESIVTDHLGTPVLMLAEDGTPTWAADVSIWGELRLTTGERAACPFRWPGQYEDLETGLHYNRFRYYDPESGQYTSQDPIGLAGGYEPHAYPADPLSAIDVYGLRPTKCGTLGGDDLEDRVEAHLTANGIPFRRGEQFGPNGSLGEIDFETPEAIIEVTIRKSGKLGQIQKLISDRVMNPRGKPVVLFAPDYGGRAGQDVTQAGGLVVKAGDTLEQDLDDLIGLIK